MYITSHYSERKAELTMSSGLHTVKLDETDCDNLLRVVEYAQDPALDVMEFIMDVEKMPESAARRFAIHFVKNATEIAKHVYADC